MRSARQATATLALALAWSCGNDAGTDSPDAASVAPDASQADASDARVPLDASFADVGSPDSFQATSPEGGGAPFPDGFPVAADGVDVGFCETERKSAVLAALPARIGPVTSDDEHVYFASGGFLNCSINFCSPVLGHVYRVPRCGGTVERITSVELACTDLVSAGPMIYFRDRMGLDGNGLGRIRKRDGLVEPLTGRSGGVIGTETHAYLFGLQGLSRWAHDSTEEEDLPATGVDPGALAVSGDRLVYTYGSTAFSASLDGSGAQEIFRATHAIGAAAIASDTTFLGERCDPCQGDESLVRVLGSGASEVVQTPAQVRAARATAGNLLWLDLAEGVLRVPVDVIEAATRVAPLRPEESFVDLRPRTDLAWPRIHASVDRYVLSWNAEAALPALEPYDAGTARPSAWEVRPGTPGTAFNRVGLDGLDGFVVRGTAPGATDLGGGSLPLVPGLTGYSGFVVKFDAAGTHVWSAGLGDSRQDGWASCLAAGPGGEVLASVGAASDCADAKVVSFAPDGNVSWEKALGACVSHCAIDGAGNAYIAESGSTDSLVRLDANGGDVWRIDLDGNVTAMAGRAAGIVLAKVQSSGALSLSAMNSTGQDEWGVPVLDQCGQGCGSVRDLVVGSDGSIVAAGTSTAHDVNVGAARARSFVAGYESFYFARLSADGTSLFVRILPGITGAASFGENLMYPSNVAVDDSGSVYVRGVSSVARIADLGPSTSGGVHPADPFVARFDGAGNHVWTRMFEDFWRLGTGTAVLAMAGHAEGVVVAGVTDQGAFLGSFAR